MARNDNNTSSDWQALDRPQWGLRTAIPEGTEVSWGSRAILSRGFADLVYCSVAAPTRKDAQLLTTALDGGILEEALGRVRELCESYEMAGDEAQLFTLYDDGDVVVVANTNASYGYLYLAAWFTAEGLATYRAEAERQRQAEQQARETDRLLRKLTATRDLASLRHSHQEHGYRPTLHGSCPDSRRLRVLLADAGIPVHPRFNERERDMPTWPAQLVTLSERYDGFGTFTDRLVGTWQGKDVRLVRMDPEHAEWQQTRYASGAIGELNLDCGTDEVDAVIYDAVKLFDVVLTVEVNGLTCDHDHTWADFDGMCSCGRWNADRLAMLDMCPTCGGTRFVGGADCGDCAEANGPTDRDVTVFGCKRCGEVTPLAQVGDSEAMLCARCAALADAHDDAGQPVLADALREEVAR